MENRKSEDKFGWNEREYETVTKKKIVVRYRIRVDAGDENGSEQIYKKRRKLE